MAARPSHLPTHFERAGLEAIQARRPIPVGRRTLARMIAKGWIELRRADGASQAYCVTSAGLEAVRRKIPTQRASRAAAPRARAVTSCTSGPQSLATASG